MPTLEPVLTARLSEVTLKLITDTVVISPCSHRPPTSLFILSTLTDAYCVQGSVLGMGVMT